MRSCIWYGGSGTMKRADGLSGVTTWLCFAAGELERSVRTAEF